MKKKQAQQFYREMHKGRPEYEQESRYEWLTPLLEAYQIADADVVVANARREKISKRRIACREGCHHCCLNPAVPINEFELMGLSFYVSEVLEGESRKIVKRQLQHHQETTACPFLVNQRCSVYPVRPLACRIFHVYDKRCEIGEDPEDTRPKDVAHLHTKDGAWMVAQKLLPLYGITNKAEQQRAFESGFLFKNARAMHTFDWTMFAKNMSLSE